MAFDQGLIEYLEIGSIRPSKLGVRTRFYERTKESLELENSIKTHGLLQPIIVRPDEHGFEIVAGHRRYRACKELRWRHMPCNIIELSDREAFEMQLIENIQRKSMDPLEEAESFRRYVAEMGWGGISDLARKIGKSEEYISQHLQMLKLPNNIKDQILGNKLKVSHALELLTLPEEVKSDLAETIVEQKMTVKQVREFKRIVFNGKKDEADITLERIHRNPTSTILKKTQLLLKIQLRRLDDLIEEVNTTVTDTNERASLIRCLMRLRVRTHSMVDYLIELNHVQGGNGKQLCP
jgi:ParB family chromosome partitioning protein